MKHNEPPIVIEQTIKAPVEAVWEAITAVDKMRRWFFENIPDFKPEIGFSTSFSVFSDDREFIHRWKITQVEPRRLLSYDWSYDSYPGDSLVTFELFVADTSTSVRLTHTVRDDFPDDIPEFTRENCRGGWEYFIQQRLTSYLE